VSCTADLIEEWKHGPDFVASEEMMRLTLRIVGLTLFSADVAKESASVGASLTEALRVFIRLNHPLVQMVGPLRRMNERRAVEARRGIEVVLLEIIEKHRLQPKAFDDMLSLLMS
jgi:cytochrome P450